MTGTSRAPASTGARDSFARRASRMLRREAPWFLSLLAVSSLAIAQPILSALSTDATIFEGRASSATAIVAFALIVTFAPTIALWAVELAAFRVSPSLRQRLHDVFLTLLSWAFFIQLFKGIDALPAPLVALAALTAGVALAVAYRHLEWVRRWLTFVSPLAVLLLINFLVLSPAWAFITAGGAPTAVAAGTATDTPVVFVVFDELGTSALLDGGGRIDRDLFPNLHRLASDSTWYRNTTTVGPHTPLALPAILTGQYPSSDLAEAATSSSYRGSLFSLLSSSHHLNVYEPFTRFCTSAISCNPHPTTTSGEELSTLLDLGQVVWQGAIDPERSADIPLNVAVRDGGDPAAYFDAFVDAIETPTDRPSLDFLHVLLPHAPYRRLPSGAPYNAPVLPTGAESWQGPWPDDDRTWAARQRHLLQAQFADAQLGVLLEELESSDRYDESLVVVTADHGSAFVTDEPSRSLTANNAPHIAWVPLLVKEPDQSEGSIDDVPIENVDILPLVADALGVEIPWATDGRRPGSRQDDVVQVVPWDAGDTPWRSRVLEAVDGRDRIELDRSAGFEEVLGTKPLGLVGTDARWRPYQRGPFAELVGRNLDTLTVADEAVEGQLDTAPVVRSAAGGALAPVYVSGRLSGGERAEVAIVVDGRVAAVVATHAGDETFAGLVPEHVLRREDSRVSIYLIDGPSDRPRLHPVSDR